MLTLLPLVLRNVTRNLRRMILTILSIAVSIFIFAGLTSLPTMALFGAPIAHEDAPRRAVRAALGIQRALRDYCNAGTRTRPEASDADRYQHRCSCSRAHRHRSAHGVHRD